MLRKLLLLFVFSGAVAAQALGAQDTPAGSTGPDARAVKPALVNLNTATAVELEVLPGVGPKVAARIVEYRKTKGPFKKIEELMNVKGIGEKNFLRLKPFVFVPARTEKTEKGGQ